MGQVVSSVKESNGFYTITVKPAKIGPKDVSKVPMANMSRYKIPPGIVNKIKTITFIDKKLEDKKLTQLEQIELMSLLTPSENVPQLCDNYDSSKPSYFYFQMDNKEQIDATMTKLYTMEKGVEWSGKPGEVTMPKDYAFLIDPCPEGITCAIDGGSLDGVFSKAQSATGIASYSSGLACTISSLCTLIPILAVNVSSSGFNALTVILILLILSSSSTCITNVVYIYKLKNEMSK
jgi:hypothetical protein